MVVNVRVCLTFVASKALWLKLTLCMATFLKVLFSWVKELALRLTMVIERLTLLRAMVSWDFMCL